MNIWMVNHNANPPSAPGDARHHSHARELIRMGHSVRIISCSFLHLNGEFPARSTSGSWQNTECEGVPFTWIPAIPYRNSGMRRIWNMFEFAWRVHRQAWARELPAPDLVLGSTPHPFAALAAQRLAEHYNVPFVLEVRDVWPYVLTEVGGHSPFHPFVLLVDWTMRFLYQRAARIIMFSRDSAHLLERSGADKAKIVWIPHGVDLTFSPPPQAPPEDGIFTVTYVGAHSQWNSLETILDAAKLLQRDPDSRVRFRLVGHGASKPALVAKAKNEGIHNVRFEDPIPKQDIVPVLHASDAFVINNRKDEVSKNWMSFNKLYEYLAAGRPVVFGSCTSNDPVRESGAGISVHAGDAVAMADAIDFLSRCSPEQLANYGRRGRRLIEESYTIPVLAGRFAAMAEQVTQQQHSTPQAVSMK